MGTLIGQTLGAYLVEDRISQGSGAFGEVYLGRDTLSGQPVALKVLFESYSHNREVRTRFKNEGDLAETLHHPHIVEIYGNGEEQNRLYIAMEYMDGGSLRDWLDQRDTQAWSLRMGLEFVCQAAEGLAHAHSQGVTHRDIKPENLLLRKVIPETSVPEPADAPASADDPMPSHYTLKVGDFGVAHIAEATVLTATSLSGGPGTMPYKAPERFKTKENDTRSDIYALGIILYQIATGAMPYETDPPELAIANILQATPELPSSLNQDIPPEVEQIILRCLEKNPDQRYQSALELANALRAAMDAADEHLDDAVPQARAIAEHGGLEDLTVMPDRMSLLLTPGQPTPFKVSVIHTGKQNDIFRVEISDVPQEWIQVEEDADILELNPHEASARSGSVSFTIMVPRDPQYQAGAYTAKVRAVSQEVHPDEYQQVDVRWTVQPFIGGVLDVRPVEGRNRRRVSYALTMYNDGNQPVEYILQPSDRRDKMRYDYRNLHITRDPREPDVPAPAAADDPDTTDVPEEDSYHPRLAPGDRASFDLVAIAPWHWFGSRRDHQVTIEMTGGKGPEPRPVALERVVHFQQVPLIPTWTVLLLLLVLVPALYLLLTPPTVYGDLVRSVDGQSRDPGENEPFQVEWHAFNSVWAEVELENQDGETRVVYQGGELAEPEAPPLRWHTNWLGAEQAAIPGQTSAVTVSVTLRNLLGLPTRLDPVLVALDPEQPVVNVFDDEGDELEEGLHAITYGDTITLNIAAQADQVRVLANGENMETYDDQTRADNNGRGELPTITDTIEIAPTETTVYAVQARNTIAADVEPKTKTFTVTVRPRIEYFGSNTEAIVAHLTDNLTMQINAPGGARYEIFANDNPEPVAGAISSNPITTVSIAAPTETTEYMLRVYSADGLEAEYPRAAIIPVSYCQIREAAPAGIELLSGPGATYNVVDNDVRGNELILTRESLSPNEEWLRVRVRNQDQAGWVRVEDIDPRSCSLNLDTIEDPAGPIAKVSPGELPPTSTPTFTPIPTPTSTPRPTSTPLPTATATPRPSATATPRPSATATPRPSATATPRPSATATPEPPSEPDWVTLRTTAEGYVLMPHTVKAGGGTIILYEFRNDISSASSGIYLYEGTPHNWDLIRDPAHRKEEVSSEGDVIVKIRDDPSLYKWQGWDANPPWKQIAHSVPVSRGSILASGDKIFAHQPPFMGPDDPQEWYVFYNGLWTLIYDSESDVRTLRFCDADVEGRLICPDGNNPGDIWEWRTISSGDWSWGLIPNKERISLTRVYVGGQAIFAIDEGGLFYRYDQTSRSWLSLRVPFDGLPIVREPTRSSKCAANERGELYCIDPHDGHIHVWKSDFGWDVLPYRSVWGLVGDTSRGVCAISRNRENLLCYDQ